MHTKGILDFLRALERNNNKVWFDAHRDEYQQAREQWLEIVAQLLAHLGSIDPVFFQQDPRKCIFRINRDVRFSRNKNPYKTNFGAFFVAQGKNSGQAGYYLHLEPDNCGLAGGLYHPEKEKLDTIRQRLNAPNCTLPAIIKSKKFVQFFEDIERTHSLKRRPNGFDENHPLIDLIRLKSYTVWKPFSEAQTLKPGFHDEVCAHFDAMTDFINWLNQS